jgi:hypothetical protein
MTRKKKDEESITIKKSTLIILIIAVVAVLIALGGLYWYNTSKDDKVRLGPDEVVELDEIIAIIAKECAICTDMTKAIKELRDAPFLRVRQSSIIEASSKEAKMLIKKYNIEKVPALILKGDTSKIPLQGFKTVKDATILDAVPPPYINLEEKRIVGLVNVTYITDKSCKQCYDATQHKEVLAYAFGIHIAQEDTVDISNEKGKQLLEKYDITKVPTIIMQGELEEYPVVQMLWDKIGTIEKDVTHVFRGFETTQGLIYKDLETNELINTSQTEEE